MSHEIFKKHNISAKKSLGQNFLVDEKKLQEIGESIDISHKNIVEV
jgi:16S rRNA A1518/A1519 N6-dimethyltransferase RsmA/KsgA/DIM1 with predicted DNA glycosylase/AP lyase activity